MLRNQSEQESRFCFVLHKKKKKITINEGRLKTKNLEKSIAKDLIISKRNAAGQSKNLHS